MCLSMRFSHVHQSLVPILSEHTTRLYPLAAFALNVDMTGFWPMECDRTDVCHSRPGH